MASPIQITENSLTDGLRAYVGDQALRGKGSDEVLRKIMRFWVSFALSRIRPGRREKIYAYLHAEVTALRVETAGAGLSQSASKQKRRSAERIDKYRNTRAARLVAALNIGGARGKDAGAFYSIVDKWVRRRLRSASHLRAGLLPAIRRLHAKGRAGLPAEKNPAGEMIERLTQDVADILVETWASQRVTKSNPRPLGVAGISPQAFEAALPEVEALFKKFGEENRLAAARRAGLTVS